MFEFIASTQKPDVSPSRYLAGMHEKEGLSGVRKEKVGVPVRIPKSSIGSTKIECVGPDAFETKEDPRFGDLFVTSRLPCLLLVGYTGTDEKFKRIAILIE